MQPQVEIVVSIYIDILKYWPILASFCFFTLHFKCKKHKCFAWDLNPVPPVGRHRRIHPSRLFVLYCWLTRPLQDDFLLSTLGQASYISCISEISFLAPPFIILILNIRSETRQQLLEFIWPNVLSNQYCQSSGKIVVNGQILYK